MKPNSGFYGDFGGQFVAETLIPALDQLEDAFRSFKNDEAMMQELDQYLTEFAGRPTPVYFAKNLSKTTADLRETFTKAESKIAMRFDTTLTNLRDELARARDKDFKSQIDKFKQEMDRVASLEKGLASLQQTDKQSSRDQAERLQVLEKLIPEVEFLREKTDALEEENKKLAEVVSKNQVQIVEAIDQKTADRRKLERNLQSQKAKMAELLKELRK